MSDIPPPDVAPAGAHPRLVLASSSVYRRALLGRLRAPFVWRAPDIDETPRPGEAPVALVERLSLTKARALAGTFGEHLIIGGDQVAVIGGRMLGKPGSRDGAIAQLSLASGRTLRFLTGVCVLDSARGTHAATTVPCDVVFRRLSRAEIEAYVDAEQPFDCAGSFKAESLGIVLFERLVSEDPTAISGLPLLTLAAMLSDAGFNPLLELPRDAAGAGNPGQ